MDRVHDLLQAWRTNQKPSQQNEFNAAIKIDMPLLPALTGIVFWSHERQVFKLMFVRVSEENSELRGEAIEVRVRQDMVRIFRLYIRKIFGIKHIEGLTISNQTKDPLSEVLSVTTIYT